MQVTDYPFTNNDTEYTLIKELLLEIETYPAMDNNWDPGRMDWWRYNSRADHAEPNISNFLYDSLKPATVKRSYTYSLNLEE